MKHIPILFLLFYMITSFGMLQVDKLTQGNYLKNKKKKEVTSNPRIQEVASNPIIDAIISIASVADGEVKNTMSKTSRYFHGVICKSNPFFVGLQSFTAHEKDINDIVLSLSWYNKCPQIAESLSKKLPNGTISIWKHVGGMWSIGAYQCSWPTQYALNLPADLNKKYVQENAPVTKEIGKLPAEAEVALLFAALSKDKKAVATIASKIKIDYDSFPVYVKLELQDCLLRKLIARNDAIAFELLVKNDPYGALNLYLPGDKTGDYNRPFLDILDRYRFKSPDQKEHFIRIYKDCGGKTLEELEPKRNCIIS